MATVQAATMLQPGEIALREYPKPEVAEDEHPVLVRLGSFFAASAVIAGLVYAVRIVVDTI